MIDGQRQAVSRCADTFCFCSDHGINGEDIFKMACTYLYGIKKKSGKLVVDNKIL